MARFYATFDNSANLTLEGTSSTYSFDRLTFTNGASLRSALLSARTTLSSQFYAQINAANQNGNNGVVVPTDGYTIGGGNLSGTNLYTNTQAVYNSDLRDRPNPPITVSNSTAVSPADSWTIAQSDYTACTTAFLNAMAGIGGLQSQPAGGVYARLNSVNSQAMTLESLWHDSNMTYFAWDDYTPGSPTSIAVNVSTTNVIVTGLSNYEFSMDRHASIYVSYAGRIIKGGVPQFVSGNTTVSAGGSSANMAHGVTGLTAGTDTWDQMDIISYYTLTNQGVYPVALGSGSTTVSGGNRTLTNQSGTINAV
jgi:hypothetical protein